MESNPPNCILSAFPISQAYLLLCSYPTRREVDNANNSRLQNLSGDPQTYVAYDRPGLDEEGNRIPWNKVEKLLERLVAPKQIILKVCTFAEREKRTDETRSARKLC